MSRTLVVILGCLLLVGCRSGFGSKPSADAEAQHGTNSFGIYLLGEQVDTFCAVTNWARLQLASQPIISDADIVAIDLTNGLMKVKRDLIERLPAPSVLGTPFVAVADGERLFVAAFWTSVSSYGPIVNAMIGLDRVPGRDYLSLGWYDPVRGRGGCGWWLGKEEAPGDPWSDPRIKKSLGCLHKLGYVKMR